jgi:hypothetical protein
MLSFVIHASSVTSGTYFLRKLFGRKDLPSNYNNARAPSDLVYRQRGDFVCPLSDIEDDLKMKTATVFALLLATATAFNTPQFATRAVGAKKAPVKKALPVKKAPIKKAPIKKAPIKKAAVSASAQVSWCFVRFCIPTSKG